MLLSIYPRLVLQIINTSKMFKHLTWTYFLSHLLKVVGRKGIREEQRAPSVGEWIERKDECDEKDINQTYTAFDFNI